MCCDVTNTSRQTERLNSTILPCIRETPVSNHGRDPDYSGVGVFVFFFRAYSRKCREAHLGLPTDAVFHILSYLLFSVKKVVRRCE
jgi:hypothetical protein